MKPINIHCSNCNQWFLFIHPAVDSVSRLLNISLSCQHCDTVLKAPLDSLHMRPLQEHINNRLKAEGSPANVVSITALQDNMTIEFDGTRADVTTLSKIDMPMHAIGIPTPAIMPPHPPAVPAPPTPKTMAHTKGKPRADRALMQRPFSSLGDLMK